TLTLRATSGLDLYATVRRAEGGPPLATLASPALTTTLAADVTGWVVLRVENRAAALATGQSYRVEVRRTLPPAPSAAPTASGPAGLSRAPAAPDALEDNYSPETAAPIAVGVLYDLNLVCPLADGCPGGDHDYLRFSVKAGERYLIATFDLADGVDTVLDLFWWSPTDGWQLLVSNDDDRAGVAFLSTIRWQAPASDGVALVRVGPREGGLNPVRSDAPSYRFAIALAGSPLATQLEARIAAQTGAPTPTTIPDVGAPLGGASLPAPVVPTPVAISADAATGAALVVAATDAHTAPDAASPTLASLPRQALVELTGRVAGLWVEVTSDALVGAAWVDRRDLRPATAMPAVVTAGAGAPGASLPPLAGLPTPIPPVGAPGAVGETTPTPRPALIVGHTTAHVTVRVAQGRQPIPGLRVVLLTALDDTLSQQTTDDAGAVVFDVPIAAGTQVAIAIPAIGLRVPVDAANPEVVVTLAAAPEVP
ncbi:hypothetical protein HGA89_04535, partial [bacterium]|nr:hypothetical protein [bacterium]